MGMGIGRIWFMEWNGGARDLPQDVHSFPTRRSSDLVDRRRCDGEAGAREGWLGPEEARVEMTHWLCWQGVRRHLTAGTSVTN